MMSRTSRTERGGNCTSTAARCMATTILSMESASVPSQSKIKVFMLLLSQSAQRAVPNIAGLGGDLQLPFRELSSQGNRMQKQPLTTLFSNDSREFIIAVFGVAGDRVTGVAGMDADLMGAPGNGPRLHQGGEITEPADDPELGQRLLALRIDLHHALPRPPVGLQQPPMDPLYCCRP